MNKLIYSQNKFVKRKINLQEKFSENEEHMTSLLLRLST